MTGLGDVVSILVYIAVVTSATHLLFAWDERRMTSEERARAWPAATRGVVVGSPLWFPLWIVGVPLHFLRTRRTLRGVGEALFWTAALLAVLMLAMLATSAAFDGAVGQE